MAKKNENSDAEQDWWRKEGIKMAATSNGWGALKRHLGRDSRDYVFKSQLQKSFTAHTNSSDVSFEIERKQKQKNVRCVNKQKRTFKIKNALRST